MTLVDWREEYETGVPDVDHEHRELIGLINQLEPALIDGDARPAVPDLLGDILAAINAHFALEERLMRDARYPEYRDHKGDHDRLLDELRDLMDDYESGRWIDVAEFARRVGDWFAVHFRTFDARLHRRLGH